MDRRLIICAALSVALAAPAAEAANAAGAPTGRPDPTPEAEPRYGAEGFLPTPQFPTGWRGDGSGHYPAADPPTTLSPGSVVWKTRLPKWSNSSPIVFGERVFVCAEPTTLICIAEADGGILWRRDAEIVDDLLTPEERPELESVYRRFDAIEREGIALRLAMSRERAKRTPGPDERRRSDMDRLKRIEALEAERAEIQKRIREVSFEERPALSKRLTEIGDILYRLRDEEAEGKPSAELSGLQQEMDRFNARHEREMEALTARLAAWSGRIPTPANIGGEMHPDTGYSTPTPVSDGRFVYAVYGTGVAACFDLDGGRRWVRQIGKPSASCGQVASPLLIGGKVIVHFAHPTEKWPDDKKFLGGIPGRLPCLTALNADTGAVVWRATVGAGAGTAVSLRLGADDILATPAGDIVRAADGRLLASGSLLVQYNSPAVEGRTLYFVDPQHDRRCTAMRLPGMIAEPLMPEVLWKNDIRKTRGFSTPLCHEGVVYAVGENSILTALDADTGERLYEQTISGDGVPFTSVVRAGGTLFAGRQNGVLVAFKPGRKYEEAGRFSLGALRSTPFFRGNRMYVRTLERVYCIERTAPPAPESAVAGNEGTGRDQ